jgi:hypothetical protein
MGFEVGAPNPGRGRPKGSRNKRTEEIFNRLEGRGDLDCANYLSSVVTNTNLPIEQRTTAAGLLMPYKYSKMGAIPPTPEPRFFSISIEVPEATTIQQARENLQLISKRGNTRPRVTAP